MVHNAQLVTLTFFFWLVDSCSHSYQLPFDGLDSFLSEDMLIVVFFFFIYFWVLVSRFPIYLCSKDFQVADAVNNARTHAHTCKTPQWSFAIWLPKQKQTVNLVLEPKFRLSWDDDGKPKLFSLPLDLDHHF